MDEWDIQGTFTYDPSKPKGLLIYADNFPPEYIQEVYVRRENWMRAYRHKVDPENFPNTHQFMMRQVPEEMDYKTRAQKNGWVIWTEYAAQNHHLPRLSDDKTEVTYYPTEKDARLDRAKTTSTVRYLRVERGYDERDIEEVCRRQDIPYASEWELKFATTREEIRHVYVNGPRSCMSGEHDTSAFGFHPVEVYACDPIGVAYLVSKTDPDHISSRTVVNMETKQWVMIYGARSQMYSKLTELGYHPSDRAISGYKLLAIDATTKDYKGTFPQPYYDFRHNTCRRSSDDKYWLVDLSEDEYQASLLDTPVSPEPAPEPEPEPVNTTPMGEPVTVITVDTMGRINTDTYRYRGTDYEEIPRMRIDGWDF